jgi:hypothetical protein
MNAIVLRPKRDCQSNMVEDALVCFIAKLVWQAA